MRQFSRSAGMSEAPRSTNFGCGEHTLTGRNWRSKTRLRSASAKLARAGNQILKATFPDVNHKISAEIGGLKMPMQRNEDWRDDDRSRRYSSRDDDDRRSSRSRSSRDDDNGRGQGRGGWFGDSEGHSEAARRGWREDDNGYRGRSSRDDDDYRSRSSQSRSRYQDDDDDRRGRGRGGW